MYQSYNEILGGSMGGTADGNPTGLVSRGEHDLRSAEPARE